MRIQHNIMAMNAYRNYTNNTSALSKNLEKLSSGYKINRAGDDAAGLAISEKMRAQITGLETAQKNAKDGISLVQTAEGALTEVHDMLNRMYELAEQSANGTFEDGTDRKQLQKEVDQLKSEINRIADSANFNGIKLLDGNLSSDTHDGTGLVSTGKLKIHFGTANDSAEDYYYIQIGDSTASALGVGNANGGGAGHDISTQGNAQKALDAINNAIVSKDNIRAHLGALQNRLENTITNLEVQSENLQSAESQISDVDVATEMTNFVRNQILTQSAVSMLGQANSLPQMALSLIG